jgi:HlyD family secretion protein
MKTLSSIPLERVSPAKRDVSGAAMDVVIPGRKWKRFGLGAPVGVAALLVLVLVWKAMPHGLVVKRSDLSITAVSRGMFLDNVVARATAMPLNSVVLDAVAGGRVDEVLVRDGATVRQGDILFRLSNTDLLLQLLARQADQAQQIANLSNLRVGLELGRSEAQKRITQQEQELRQSERECERSQRLAESGYISQKALEIARDQLKLNQQLLADYKRSAQIESRTRIDAIRQLELSMQKIDGGLRVVMEHVEALNVRAPMSGRLADFDLLVGTLVKAGDHTGRIDEPGTFKLMAPVDEFYLNRVSPGLPAHAQINGGSAELVINRIYPQIKEGRFMVELHFVGAAPDGIHPGQTVDAHLVLGRASQALLLPNAAFVNDTGGNWAYVLDPDGHTASKRVIRIGRRNNQQLEVTSGLKEGEQVVVSSYTLFKNNDRLDVSK